MLATFSSDLATHKLELLFEPALAWAGSLGELQLIIYWHWGGEEIAWASYLQGVSEWTLQKYFRIPNIYENMQYM